MHSMRMDETVENGHITIDKAAHILHEQDKAENSYYRVLLLKKCKSLFSIKQY